MIPDERLANAEHSLQHHDAAIALLTELMERSTGRIEMLEGIAERQQALLRQVQRDFAVTRRLWTRLALRYGWLEEDPPYWDDEGDEG